MNTIRVYIADADVAHIRHVSQALAMDPRCTVIGAQCDGVSALREIEALRPDVLITDIQLPSLEGTALLERLRRKRRAPFGIVCTRFYSELSVETAYRCGASYVLYKPIDYARLPALVALCRSQGRGAQETQTDPSLSAGAARLLDEAGISARLAARAYLTSALLTLSRDRMPLQNLSKGLYPLIAACFGTAPACVERSLRSAIDAAYSRGSLARAFIARPSNKAFIEYLLSRIDE